MAIGSRLVICFTAGGLFWMAAAVAAHAGPLGNTNGAAAPLCAQVMLYVSHSVGGDRIGGVTRPTFGLMVEQIRQIPNMGGADGGDSLLHRELINWQMNLHKDLRLGLGHKITYDVLNRSFRSAATWSRITIDAWTLRGAPAGVTEPKVAPAGVLDSRAERGQDIHEASITRQMAATVMSALSPARFTFAQRQNTQRRWAQSSRSPGLPRTGSHAD